MRGTPTAFSFNGLPHLSRSQVRLSSYLDALQSRLGSLDAIVPQLEQKLSESLNQTVLVRFVSASLQNGSTIPEINSASLFCVGLRFTRNWVPATLCIPTPSARKLIHGFLGIENETTDAQPLTALESGIFDYLCANALMETRQALTSLGELVLERRTDQEQALSWLKNTDAVLQIDLTLELGSHKHAFSVLLAADGVKELLWETANTSDSNPTEKGLERIAHVKVPIRFEVGQVSLGHDELQSLEVDDIIVVEASHLKLKENTLVGSLEATVGVPQVGTLNGPISIGKDGRYLFQIESIRPQVEPILTPYRQTSTEESE